MPPYSPVNEVEATRMAERGRTMPAVVMVSAATMLLLTACGVPLPTAIPTAQDPVAPSSDVDVLAPTGPVSDELDAHLTELAARVAEVRALLDEAADAPDRGDALGAAAVAALLGTDGSGPGVLPAVEPDRAGQGSDDLVTGLVTLAGDLGGSSSRVILELVRDPLVGDLGAWQRDPVGVIDLLRTIAATAIADTAATGRADVTTLDAAVLELTGELSRALGYALVVAGSDDVVLSGHAATAASARLGVVMIAIELAREELGMTS
jgi:hypothetical protein